MEPEPKRDLSEPADTTDTGGFLADFWLFLRHNKKWWLTPIIVLLLGLGVLIVWGGSGAAPFIYSVF
ncbi:MAG: hypothetical protein HY236_00375 [Acidobacteria bacterium]|nr:hypothetical protein [Acidobacteriota bacterium]